MPNSQHIGALPSYYIDIPSNSGNLSGNVPPFRKGGEGYSRAQRAVSEPPVSERATAISRKRKWTMIFSKVTLWKIDRARQAIKSALDNTQSAIQCNQKIDEHKFSLSCTSRHTCDLALDECRDMQESYRRFGRKMRVLFSNFEEDKCFDRFDKSIHHAREILYAYERFDDKFEDFVNKYVNINSPPYDEGDIQEIKNDFQKLDNDLKNAVAYHRQAGWHFFCLERFHFAGNNANAYSDICQQSWACLRQIHDSLEEVIRYHEQAKNNFFNVFGDDFDRRRNADNGRANARNAIQQAIRALQEARAAIEKVADQDKNASLPARQILDFGTQFSKLDDLLFKWLNASVDKIFGHWVIDTPNRVDEETFDDLDEEISSHYKQAKTPIKNIEAAYNELNTLLEKSDEPPIKLLRCDKGGVAYKILG